VVSNKVQVVATGDSQAVVARLNPTQGYDASHSNSDSHIELVFDIGMSDDTFT